MHLRFRASLWWHKSEESAGGHTLLQAAIHLIDLLMIINSRTLMMTTKFKVFHAGREFWHWRVIRGSRWCSVNSWVLIVVVNLRVLMVAFNRLLWLWTGRLIAWPWSKGLCTAVNFRSSLPSDTRVQMVAMNSRVSMVVQFTIHGTPVNQSWWWMKRQVLLVVVNSKVLIAAIVQGSGGSLNCRVLMVAWIRGSCWWSYLRECTLTGCLLTGRFIARRSNLCTAFHSGFSTFSHNCMCGFIMSI